MKPAVTANQHTGCCAACAAAQTRTGGPQAGKARPSGAALRFGSYALPLRRVIQFGAALFLWAAGFLVMERYPRESPASSPLPLQFLPLLPLLAAYALAGLPVLKNAFRNLRQGHGLDENFLMAIATLGAFGVGDWEEAVGVMIFYMIGELIQEAAVERSRASINALLALKPDTARIASGGEWIETAAGQVAPGTLTLVRPGERIPLDGVVTEGRGFLDTSMLSGESRPAACKAGDEVYSGTISLDGVLTIRTTKTADNSSAARIIALVESAREAKAKPERFITLFARWYTPLVVGAAALVGILPPLFLPDARFADWIYRALILLVISCPCALVVSIPLGYFAGIGGLSRRGIMVKGAAHLDSLHKTRYVVFDKTGTLTEGKFALVKVEPAGVSERVLLETAVLAERESNHPIAKAICKGAGERGISLEDPLPAGLQYREIAGQGLELRSGGQTILAGNRRLLESQSVGLPSAALAEIPEAHTAVYIARAGAYCGRLLIGDALKTGAQEAVRRLQSLGVAEVALFTGDAQAPAEAVARRLGIAAVKAELMPQDKLRELEKFCCQGITLFAGDGINDAPVLARSDVGIAMGSGADAAVEAADVIIMTDDPRRVPEAIERSRRTRRIVMGNVAFALAAKGLFILLAVMGAANMWIALIGDVGVALAAILNASRALR
jgi:Cd2+/Zn2+-exporting ATPase